MSARVVIVTGASRGIGLAVAQLLAKPLENCNVVVVARSSAPLEALRSQEPERVEVLAGDLGDLTLGARAVGAAMQRWGRLDGLVLNHGRLEPVERIGEADVEEWRAGFDVNVFSYVAMIKAALPELRKSRGRVIMTSSGAAVKATSTWGFYGASKAVINHLAATLAKEEQEVTTLAIRPGVVDTGMQDTLAKEHFSKMDPADVDRFRTLKKEGKMLRAEQPGNVMARLVLDAPAELSGRFLNWDDEALAKFQDI